MIEAFFNALAAIGLGHPLTRTVAFGAAGFGVQYLLKPSISYVTVPAGRGGASKAVAKDFAATSSSSQTTWFPWFFWPILFAVVGGLFI